MSVKHILVYDKEYGEAVELPLEDNHTLLLSTLTSQFLEASGLKYRIKNNVVIGVRLVDGHFYISYNDWGKMVFYYIFLKVENKKKINDNIEDPTVKTKKLEIELKCSDLIVLNIPYAYDEQQLHEYFGQFGVLILLQIKRHLNGRSWGFGFIRYTNLASQAQVISQCHIIGGRNCKVEVPKAKERYMYFSRKVFVGRITESLSADDIYDYFSNFGEVTEVFVTKNPFRGCAFVTFLDPKVAASLHGEDHIIKDASVLISKALSTRNRHQLSAPSKLWMPNLQCLDINGQDNYNPMFHLNSSIVADKLLQAARWSMIPLPPPPSEDNQWFQQNNYITNNDYNLSGNC